MRNECKYLCFMICLLYSYRSFSSEELNLDFLQGTSVVPSILKDDFNYPAGLYNVDIIVNGKNAGKVPLTISHEEEVTGVLCLSGEWMQKAGVLLNTSEYNDVFNVDKDCYQIGGKKHTQVNFNYGMQSLEINIPQAYLLNELAPVNWDYGINAGKFRYYGNFNKSTEGDLNAFGNLDLDINLGRWVLSGNMNVSHNGSETEISSSDLTLFTALSQVQGDLLLGKSQTRSELFRDVNFYGAALRSNGRMRSDKHSGYAPVITGIAPSASRLTIKQNGYTVYSVVIPAGPYRIDDLQATGNGDLVVSVEDESGHVTETVYPVSTLPTLLRPGEFRYDLAVGKKSTSDKLNKSFSADEDLFGFGSFDYGFAYTTLNTAVLFNKDYQNAGVGITQTLGTIGAMSFSANTSKARYDNGLERRGQSFGAKFAKNFGERTDLQLLAYRYQSEGYTEFSDFDPARRYFINSEKSRYEARLSHRIENTYITGSFWQQNYWKQTGSDVGANLSLSTGISSIMDGASLFMNGSWSKRPYDKRSDYSVSLGISLPFGSGSSNYYSNSNVGYSREGGTSFNTGVSATVDNRFNYNLNANTSSRGEHSVSASGSYAFDAIQTNMSVSQTQSRYSGARTSVSGGVRGAVLVTGETPPIFTKEGGSTVGIVNIPDVPGVSFNGSMPTDRNGNTVVWLSEYYGNNININMDNIPDNVELATTSYNVVPTEKAVIYRKFGVEYVLRYILQVKDKQGHILTGGNAVTERGVNAGFISNNGVLLMSLSAEPEKVAVELSNGTQCMISGSVLKPNTNHVQEVRCE